MDNKIWIKFNVLYNIKKGPTVSQINGVVGPFFYYVARLAKGLMLYRIL